MKKKENHKNPLQNDSSKGKWYEWTPHWDKSHDYHSIILLILLKRDGSLRGCKNAGKIVRVIYSGAVMDDATVAWIPHDCLFVPPNSDRL